MKSSALEGRRAIAEAAERYMRQLSLSEEIKQRAQPGQPETSIQAVGPYIAISREAGAGGYEIGRRIGAKLGWDVLGRDILDEMSERYHLPRNLLEFVDEKSANWWHEMLGTLLDQKIVTQEAFVWHLGKIILLAATKGRVIFVGRGAQFFLPRDRGVSVRIVAPEKERIQYLMDTKGLSRTEAQNYAASTEKHRHDFIQRYFHRDVADAHLYDLVINTEHVGLDGAVEMILSLYHRCPCSKDTGG
jgi:cytidylate kinase